MSEPSDQWLLEQLASALNALGSKFYYTGDSELSRRCHAAAEELERDDATNEPAP